MGERGSTHRASVIQIFAYAGYKRDEHGRFVARACGWKLLFLVLVPVFFSWMGVLARAGGPSSLSFVGRSSSARESAHPSRLSSTPRKGEQVPRRSARGPDTERTRRSVRHFAAIRSERAGLGGTTRRGKSQLLFSFLSFGFLCKCLWEGACGE